MPFFLWLILLKSPSLESSFILWFPVSRLLVVWQQYKGNDTLTLRQTRAACPCLSGPAWATCSGPHTEIWWAAWRFPTSFQSCRDPFVWRGQRKENSAVFWGWLFVEWSWSKVCKIMACFISVIWPKAASDFEHSGVVASTPKRHSQGLIRCSEALAQQP